MARIREHHDRDEHIEKTPTEARQAGVGRHAFAILAVSTVLAAVGLAAFFVTTAVIS